MCLPLPPSAAEKRGDRLKILERIKRRQKYEDETPTTVLQTAGREMCRPLGHVMPFGEYELYRELREKVPVIDAALDKTVRLIGSFSVACSDKAVERELNGFLKNVGTGGGGIYKFISVYLDQLLTYGTAVGEIVLTGSGRDIYSIENVPLKNVELKYDDNMIDAVLCRPGVFGQNEPFECQELLLMSALNPEPGRLAGVSVLHGLPFVSDVLMKIYSAIGVNWERLGNIRFAVTYKPSSEGDRSLSKNRAKQIAEEWSKAMRDKESVSDFVSVGDVSIKVIGADNQILDSEVPVRQMLEQIIAKLSVPPFLLGLSWSTTERMSSQQADILTSELEYYRRILDVVIGRIVNIWLQLHGFDCEFNVVWDNINLQDELDLAKARLYNAQAAEIEKRL